MILKWIKCIPQPDRLSAYLEEQAIWNHETFAHESVGSYVMASRPGKVLLLMEWPDQAAIDRFMAGLHDDLMRDHPLGDTLAAYHVAYFDWVEDVGAPPDWALVAPKTAVVRHTLREVPTGGFEAFMAAQCRPDMSQAPGFLGGRIWRRTDDPTCILVVTYFRGAGAPMPEAWRVDTVLYR